MAEGLASRIHQLTLTVTERCNQRCTYCYVDKGRGRTMGVDVAHQALEWLVDQAPPEEELVVSFFGGEPFLEPKLMERVARTVRRLAGEQRRLRFGVTTNGTAVDGKGVALIRDLGLELAVSFDGETGQTARPLRGGGSSTSALRSGLPRFLDQGRTPLGRMTVTPDNVGDLARNVKSVFRAGFERILYLPAYEAHWDGRAVARWAREHDRLFTWLMGLHGAGRRDPDLPAWRGILGRLSGAPRQGCGAGVTQVAVAPDGRMYPCYRMIYGPGHEERVLGDVGHGLTCADPLEALASLTPDGVRPEVGSCAACSARQGCGFFCPALGHLMLGDFRAVPRSVCELIRIQVEVCRRFLELGMARPRRAGRSRWRAAALAMTLLGGGLVGCGSDSAVGQRDAGSDATIGPGVCPVYIDGGTADGAVDDASVQRDGQIGPGVCPVVIDAGSDATIGPGLCPFIPDAGPDSGFPPGIC